MKIVVGVVAVAVLAGLVLYPRFMPAAQPQKAEGPRTVRWLLTHKPTDLFARATKVFSDELSKNTNGRFALKVVTPEEVGLTVPGDVEADKVFELLNSNATELASAYTVALGQKDAAFWGLNLPFLFKSYDSAPALLDGQTGLGILGGLKEGKALAFTMSGGYRVIASKTKITSSADLKGLHIATSGGPVASATLSALGAVPVAVDLEAGTSAIDPKTIDAVETTYSRLSLVLGANTPYKNFIFESNHSMFLTAIIASNSFYNSLTPEDQAAFQKAALAAAAVEREDSIALGAQTKADLEKSGTVVTAPSAKDQDTMHKAAQTVYAKFQETIGADLIKALTQ